jgi:hypothetical protein
MPQTQKHVRFLSNITSCKNNFNKAICAPTTMEKTNQIHIEDMLVLLGRMYLGAMTQNMAMTMFYMGTFATNVNCRL